MSLSTMFVDSVFLQKKFIVTILLVCVSSSIASKKAYYAENDSGKGKSYLFYVCVSIKFNICIQLSIMI